MNRLPAAPRPRGPHLHRSGLGGLRARPGWGAAPRRRARRLGRAAHPRRARGPGRARPAGGPLAAGAPGGPRRRPRRGRVAGRAPTGWRRRRVGRGWPDVGRHRLGRPTWLKTTLLLALGVGAAWLALPAGSGWFPLVCLAAVLADLLALRATGPRVDRRRPLVLVVGPMSTPTPPKRRLFGDPAPVEVPAQQRRAISSNDLDLMAGILQRPRDPRLHARRPDRPRVPRVDPGDIRTVEPVPRYEQDAVRQLLDAGHLTIGGAHTVTYGDRTGPAHSVLIPKATRAMAARWASLRPLPPATPAAAADRAARATRHREGPRPSCGAVARRRGLARQGAGDVRSGRLLRRDHPRPRPRRLPGRDRARRHRRHRPLLPPRRNRPGPTSRLHPRGGGHPT